MVGFISAVGVNIILGQLANLTGYKASGANRVIRALDTLAHPGQLHLQSLAVGLVTVALILVLERTRLGPLGLVLAVIATSAAVRAGLGWSSVATVVIRDCGHRPRCNTAPRDERPGMGTAFPAPPGPPWCSASGLPRHSAVARSGGRCRRVRCPAAAGR